MKSYINSYLNTLEKLNSRPRSTIYIEIIKIRNTNLQFQRPGHGWQKNNKKNTNKCKALCVSRKSNQLATKLFPKPTDRQNYLHKPLERPEIFKQNIPYS